MNTLNDRLQPKSIWMVEPDTGNLTSPYSFHPQLELIKIAQPMTVAVKNCVIFEDLDRGFRGDNDLIILTHNSLGNKQPIRQVHFWEKEIPAGTPIQHILSNNVVATEDYLGDDFWFELEVTEVDTDSREFNQIMDSFQSLVTLVGGVFPVLAGYTSVANIIGNSLKKLFQRLEKDDRIIKFPIRFHHYNLGDTIRRGDAPLQAGDYVIFTKPVRGLAYRMGDDGLVHLKPNIPLPSEERARNLLEKVSYLSFSIYPEMKASPEFIIGQKMETLLSQLRYNKSSRGSMTLDFLIETMTAYKNIKELERYNELFRKEQEGKELTKEEKARMEAIKENLDIKDYLPK